MKSATQLANRIEGWFTTIDKAVTALSGGIDSSLVAFVARKQLGKENAVAVISASVSVKQKELKDARNFCQQFDIVLNEIDAKEIENNHYRENLVNRCFFCKSVLYIEMEKFIMKEFKGYYILNGNNFSDIGDFRPGLKAAKDHKVLSPLTECKFTKDDIRKVARWYGLPNWSKPASPCLSSRFPYGEVITVEKLKMVEKAEDLLNLHGFDDVRVRFVNNSARIEVHADRISELQVIFSKLAPEIKSIGFKNCEIDLEGLVSGKMNRDISD
jgi:uncharacterized protein